MANNTFNNANLNIFFDKLDGGATWSAGVAFKRAAALPLERYEVHKSYADALDYAKNNAVAYPGQVIAIVEKEGTIEKIKIYYIDEAKNLQEVGSATLGDDVTIVLDPATKKLSIQGFENAGYAETNDETVKTDKKYYTYANEKYTQVTAPTGNPKENGYYERIAVKLVKNSEGNLAWITDDAVQISDNVAALQKTVKEHTQKIGQLETDVDNIEKDLANQIASLGTVFSYVGTLTVTEFAATTGADTIIDANVKIPDDSRVYRSGDVVFVTTTKEDGTTVYTQEYVATSTANGLVWEAFGDPTGVAGVEAAIESLQEASTGHTNAIKTLNEAETVEGSVKKTAKGYADTALQNANAYTDGLVNPLAGRVGTLETAVSGHEDRLDGHDTSIGNLETAIGSDTTTGSVKGRIKAIEDSMATDTELANAVTELETKISTHKNEADAKYATKTALQEVSTTANQANTKAGQNATAIEAINTAIGDENTAGSLKKRVKDLEGTTGTHTTQISTLQGQYTELTGANGPIKAADDKAGAAATAAANAQKTADEAKSAAGVADGKAAAAQKTADDALAAAGVADGKAEAAQTAANEAKTAADNAQTTANEGKTAAGNAQTTANEAKAKAEANEAKFSGYYTKGEVDTKVAGVVGVVGDTADKDTVKGAKKYTDDAITGVNTTINNLKGEIKNLTNVMNFIGKATEDPSTITDTTGKIAISGKTDKHTPEIGDVVVYGELEYVFVGGTDLWEIFGNVTADESRFTGIEDDIDALEGRMDTAESDIDTLQDTVGTHGTSINGLETRVTTLEGEMDAVEAELTRINPILEAAATKTELANEVTRATARENAIEQYAKDGFAAQSTQNTTFTNAINNITNVTDGLLAWGEF